MAEKAEHFDSLEQSVEGQILRLKAQVFQLENHSKGKRQQANKLFEFIRQNLLEREAALFKQISGDLERETRQHRT